MSAITDKSDSLAKRMNKITEKLTNNLDLSDDMEITGDDIVEMVQEKTQEVELFVENDSYDSYDISLTSELINLTNMVQDFKFVRETLKENTENARKVLNSVTLDLLDAEDNKRANLILSFAELNRSVADNMKLYITSYKEISNVLLNINKIKQSEIGLTDNNSKDIANITAVSTMDLIKQLSETTEK